MKDLMVESVEICDKLPLIDFANQTRIALCFYFAPKLVD